MKTVYRIFPKNKKCLDWIHKNVHSEPWQWVGESLVIEHRYIADIILALIEQGFKPFKDFTADWETTHAD